MLWGLLPTADEKRHLHAEFRHNIINDNDCLNFVASKPLEFPMHIKKCYEDIFHYADTREIRVLKKRINC